MILHALALLVVAVANAQDSAVPAISTENVRMFEYISRSKLDWACRDHRILTGGFAKLTSLYVVAQSQGFEIEIYMAPIQCADGKIDIPLLLKHPDGTMELRRSSYTYENDGTHSAVAASGRAGDWLIRTLETIIPGECDPVGQHWWYAYNPKLNKVAIHHLGSAGFGTAGMGGLERTRYDSKRQMLKLEWKCERYGEFAYSLSSIESYKIVNGSPIYIGKRLGGYSTVSAAMTTFVSPSTTSASGPLLSSGTVRIETLKRPRWLKLRQGTETGWQLREKMIMPDGWDFDENGSIDCLNTSATAGQPLP